MATDWVPVVFDGSAGGMIAAAAAFLGAVAVNRHQSKSDKELARRERRLNLATDLLMRMSESREPLVHWKSFKSNEELAQAQTDILTEFFVFRGLAAVLGPEIVESLTIKGFPQFTVDRSTPEATKATLGARTIVLLRTFKDAMDATAAFLEREAAS